MVTKTDPEYEADSVAKFIEVIKRLPTFESQSYTFRGEANIGWKLKPGLMRAGRERLLEHERDATRELISVHPHEFITDKTMFDKLVRMQHYELPTRLVDVSGNPLVALFNATSEFANADGSQADGRVYALRVPPNRNKYYDSDTISCVSNLANLSNAEKQSLLTHKSLGVTSYNDPKKNPAADRLLQFIREEKPAFRPLIKGYELDMTWYVMPKLSNRRIIAQNGAFLIFGLSDTPRSSAEFERIKNLSIRIPSLSKPGIRADLESLGITESTLFPEIDKAAAFIKKKYA